MNRCFAVEEHTLDNFEDNVEYFLNLNFSSDNVKKIKIRIDHIADQSLLIKLTFNEYEYEDEFGRRHKQSKIGRASCRERV